MNTTEQSLIESITAHQDAVTEVMQKHILFAGDYAAWQRLYEAVTKPETVEGYLTPNDLANLDYGTFDLGTHTVISGGDVLELGPQTNDNDEIPF
jgi:hypothetical protein